MHCKATQTLLELMLRVGKNIKKYKSEDIINPNDLLVIGTCSKDNHQMYCLQIH